MTLQRRQDVGQEVAAGSGNGVKGVTEDGGEVVITGGSVAASVSIAADGARGVEDGGDVVVAEGAVVAATGGRAAGAAGYGGDVVVAKAREGTDVRAGFVAESAGAVVVAVTAAGPSPKPLSLPKLMAVS